MSKIILKLYIQILFYLLFCLSITFYCSPSYAVEIDEMSGVNLEDFRANCAPAKATAELNINNVRARIFSGGNLWGQLSSKPYIVPNPSPGEPRYNLFLGSGLVVGGLDEYDNLRVSSGAGEQKVSHEWRPGPIVESGVGPDPQTCLDWDRLFEVRFEDIENHRKNIRKYIEMGNEYPPDEIPDRIKFWPGRGNPFFSEKYEFDLPHHAHGLAPFYDYKGNGIYNPAEGDFPVLKAGDCAAEYNSRVPDQMFFWIFNDAGTSHFPLSSAAFLEFRVQGFAFESNSELGEMTFYNYRMVNRGPFHLDSLHVAKVLSPDLGCAGNNFIGSNPDLDMMYLYVDSQSQPADPDDCNCHYAGGKIPTYCDHTPGVGLSFLEGFSDAGGEDMGMSVFTYYRTHPPVDEPGTSTPNSSNEFFNVISGSWRDGLPITQGGSGYSPTGGTEVKHVFPDPPHDPAGWSYCTEDFPPYDLTTVMSTGPVSMMPGGSNEFTLAVSWVPDLDYPCPDLSRLFSATKRARTLFNSCFEVEMRGPDAPDLAIEEGGESLQFTIENNWPESNNANEDYREKGTYLPDGIDDEDYIFEGYKVYQLRNQYVEPDPENLRDVHLARLVFQTDVENGIDNVYNWEPKTNPNPLGRRIYRPMLMAEGSDSGIEHNFVIDRDAFSAGGNGELIPGETYYYTAVAYAYNNYEQFNWREPEVGQRTQYISSTRNVTIYPIEITNDFREDEVVEETAMEDGQYSPSEYSEELGLKVYGNPTVSDLRIEIQNAGQQGVQLKVISSLGQVVYSGSYTDGMHQIPTAVLPAGFYFIEIFDPVSDEKVVRQWVKQ